MTEAAHRINAAIADLAVPIDSLVPYPGNPRRGDLATIRASLERNGQYRPVVARAGSREVLAGNHTLAAAVELGWTAVAATFVDVDDETARRIVAVDNRANDLAGYDDQALADLLRGLADLDGSGWRQRELDRLIDELAQAAGGDAARDTEPMPLPAEPVARRGDLWTLGEHRLLCGDSTDADDVTRLLAGEHAEMVWTDPPYGVAYQVSLEQDAMFARRRRQDGLVVPNDDLALAQLEELLRAAFRLAYEHSAPGGGWYVMGPGGVNGHRFSALLDELGVLRESLVWVKDSFVFGRQDYHYQHEQIFYGWRPGAAHRFHGGATQATVRDDEPDPRQLDKRQLVALVRDLRNERGTSVHRAERPRSSPLHPTTKPVELVARHLGNSSLRGELVYDPFGGAGTTMIAAENLGRRCAIMELEPGYCDVIVDRWQRHTGGRAELERPPRRARTST